MRIKTCCTSVEDESLKLNTLTQFSQKDGDLHENPPFVQKVCLTLSLNSNKTFYYKRMSSHSRCSKEEDKILQRRHLQFSTAHWINFALSCWNSKSLSHSFPLPRVCVALLSWKLLLYRHSMLFFTLLEGTLLCSWKERK